MSEEAKQKLVQQGVAKYPAFEEQEVEIAVDSYFDERQSGETFDQFLHRDGWLKGAHQSDGGGGMSPVADDDDDTKYYLTAKTNGASIVDGEQSEEEEEDKYGEDHVYSTKKSGVAGLNKHGYPIVHPKTGEDGKVSCAKTVLHTADRQWVRGKTASDLLAAAAMVAQDIDKEDRVNKGSIGKDFLEDVLSKGEKEFGVDRDEFTLDQASKAATEFMRHVEDKKRGDVILSSSKHFKGSEHTVRTGGDISDDNDDYDIPPVLKGIHKAPCRQKPARGRVPEATTHKTVNYVQAFSFIANHSRTSQQDEIWISARNVADMAHRKIRAGTDSDLANTRLTQASYYIVSATAFLAKALPSVSEKAQGWARDTLQEMLYRALYRRQSFPGKLIWLSPNWGNKYDGPAKVFRADNLGAFKKEAFEKSEGFFRSMYKKHHNLREAESNIAGILQGPQVSPGGNLEETAPQIRALAEKHFSYVFPAIYKKENGEERIVYFTFWLSWVFTHLYTRILTHATRGLHNGDWLLSKIMEHLKPLVPKGTDLRLTTIVRKFDWAMNIVSPANVAPTPQRTANGLGRVTETYPNQPSRRYDITQRIGSHATLDKSRAVMMKKDTDTREDVISAAADYLLADGRERKARTKYPGTRILLMIPKEGTSQWKQLENAAGRPREGSCNDDLYKLIPAHILVKTGKYEFTSMANQVYSAISPQSKDLQNVDTKGKIRFAKDGKMKRVKYEGDGPTFCIAEVVPEEGAI